MSNAVTDAGTVLPLQGLDRPTTGKRAGFRLARIELLNWGTFHKHVWGFNLHGDNALLTGDIGSGKSTIVDAITTLLVPPQKITYNKAAGAEARERSLRSYVRGYFKSERGEAGLSARPVPLRDNNSYSVILAQFRSEDFAQDVTLAQVFWTRAPQDPPARLYIVADAVLSIAEHFSGFGTDIDQLRKRLRRAGKLELHDGFPAYGASYRRRFGIETEQAIDLFYQTVSMKSVGNLTDFVREHMLEVFAVEPRTAALIAHFEDLNRAHEAVIKARTQVERLAPLVADCDEHARLDAEVHELRAVREALRPWFATLKRDLLDERLRGLAADLARGAATLEAVVERRREEQARRDEIRLAIAANGGDRIERIAAEIATAQTEKQARAAKAAQYDELAVQAGLRNATNLDAFAANQAALGRAQEAAEGELARTQNAATEAAVDFQQLKQQHDELAAEVESLRQRRSSIPRRMLDLREALCRAVGVGTDALPFAGELIQVRPESQAWEGAIERVLHNFGMSLLVPDEHYGRVAEWVDRTRLEQRLVYYRARAVRAAERSELHPASLVRKLAVKPDSSFYAWLEQELAQRFDYACCDTIDQFRRERQAITRAGQVKSGGVRHEKDDRHAIDDRARFVLGWSNEGKIAALERQAGTLQARMQAAGGRIAALEATRRSQQARLSVVQRLGVFQSFRDLDWKPLAAEIDRLTQERRALEAGSDVLRTLKDALDAVEAEIVRTVDDLAAKQKELARLEERQSQALALRAECESLLASVPDALKAQHFPRLEAARQEAPGAQLRLTVESCDARERDFREWLQAKIDMTEARRTRLSEKIVKAMEAYRKDYPQETLEADASVAAAGEYRAMLERLRGDDLPRFEARFKELLNENTIREIANFQSQLNRERRTIRERIDTINQSLREIDYNSGRYIRLETEPSTDAEIRDFQQDLRRCTEGTLGATVDDAYSEAKFLQVKLIIERFKGREGTGELDRRWTRKVTDVRNWFSFSASERWREDDREHEHYTDSGGKSGGQKEKLAYTVLAASLAYQFGLEHRGGQERSFRFVVIDEAFARGSDESARFGLELFKRLDLQLLVVTPLQKIHIIEPYVANVGFVHNEDGGQSMLRNLTIEEYRAERAARRA